MCRRQRPPAVLRVHARSVDLVTSIPKCDRTARCQAEAIITCDLLSASCLTLPIIICFLDFRRRFAQVERNCFIFSFRSVSNVLGGFGMCPLGEINFRLTPASSVRCGGRLNLRVCVYIIRFFLQLIAAWDHAIM